MGWSYLTVAVKAPLTLLVLAILSRLLAPGDFGQFALAWMLLDLGRRLGQTSIGHAIIQRRDLADHEISAGFALSTATGFAVAAALWLIAPLFGRIFVDPVAPQLVQALSVTFVVGGAGVVSEHLLRRDLRFRDLAVADLSSYALGNGLTAVILAACGAGVWALVWGELVRTLIRTAAVVLPAPPRPRLRVAPLAVMGLMTRGVGFSFVQLFDFIVKAGGYFAVGRWLGVVALGYYTRADRLASLVFEYVGGSLFEVAFPAMARRQRRVDRLRVVYVSGVEMLSVATLPAGVMMAALAPEIVAVALGAQWDRTVSVLRILAFAIPLQLCGVLNVAVLRAMGGVHLESWRLAAHAGLVVVGAWFGSRHGPDGVAAAMVGAQAAAYLLMTHAALSCVGIRWSRLLRCHVPALWVGAWVGLALGATAGGLRASSAPGVLVLAVEILVWGVVAAMAIRHAPPVFRPASMPWALAQLPLAASGAPGRCVRSGLEWLAAPQGRQGSP